VKFCNRMAETNWGEATFQLPTLKEQKRIAAELDELDAKGELTPEKLADGVSNFLQRHKWI